VNAQNPDLILMTGDYLNRCDALPRLRRFVDQLDSKYGIYATFGNWDAGKEHQLFENTRVIPLRDSRVELQVEGGRISLVGIDKQNGYKSGGLLKALDRESFNILLHHTPDLIEDIAPYGTTDLYLAGHTHGGQVRVPFLRGIKNGFKGHFPYAGSVAALSKFGTKYESGRFQVEDTVLYVNRGVGMEGGLVPRVRLFCPPEIAVFDLDPKRS
jgi:predicted MPP superfamily phosphohydrolase